MDYREIYKDEQLIGRIGQKPDGEVVYTSVEGFKQIIKSFISPVKIDETINEGDVSVSSSRVVLTNNIEWIGVMDLGLPPQYYATPIKKITKSEFDF